MYSLLDIMILVGVTFLVILWCILAIRNAIKTKKWKETFREAFYENDWDKLKQLEDD